jgi:serine/threonine-protein kinase
MIVDTSDNPYFVKLLDFGLAKTKTFTRLTKTGLILGSIYYLSPEQILETGVTTASDIYSLGIICSEMLTGQKPFEGTTEDNIINRILNKDPLPPSVSRPDIPETLNLLVMAMIDKDPNLRPPADSVMEAIKEIAAAL